MVQVEEVSDKIIEVLNVMKESIKVYTPEKEDQVERIDKIIDYIEQTKTQSS